MTRLPIRFYFFLFSALGGFEFFRGLMNSVKHVLPLLLISLLPLSCGGDDSLNDFVRHVITGYTPFDRIVANDQIRVGFTKSPDGDFSFNRFLTGSVSVPGEVAREVRFSLKTEDIANLSVKVKSIISGGLDYSDIDTINIRAKGIGIVSFPAGYLIHLPRAGPESPAEGEIITEIARIESLFVDVIYKSGFGGEAKLDSEMRVVQSGLTVGSRTSRSFTIVSTNRPIAYHPEKINPANIIYDPNSVVLFGHAATAAGAHCEISIEYSTGFHPIESEVDPFGWYSVSVPVNGLSVVRLIGTDGSEIGKHEFVPGQFQYDF